MKENQLSLHVRDTIQIAKHKLKALRKDIDKIDEENEELEDDSIHESGQINILTNSSVSKKAHPNMKKE
jgi:predicted  nucleic acid-binding Zn-ribbon protein